MAGEEKINLIIITGTGGMLLLAIIVISFIVIYQRKMYAKQRELDLVELDAQKRLVEAEIQVKEREQKRVAQELHDEIGASLTAIRFLFEDLDEDNKVKPKLKSSLKDITQKVRRISNDLLPSVLEEFGLMEAIRDFVGSFNSNDQISFKFIHKHYSHQVVDKEIELSLYRIVQELTNNILKYAEASEIEIELKSDASDIIIIIVDNGNGVIPLKENATKTLGLKNIESRLQYINATIKREKNKLKGTTVTIHKPNA